MPINPTTKKVKNHIKNLIKTLEGIHPKHKYEIKEKSSKVKISVILQKQLSKFPPGLRSLLKTYMGSRECDLYMDGKKILKILLPDTPILKMDAVFLNDKIVSQFCEKVNIIDVDLFRTNVNPK